MSKLDQAKNIFKQFQSGVQSLPQQFQALSQLSPQQVTQAAGNSLVPTAQAANDWPNSGTSNIPQAPNYTRYAAYPEQMPFWQPYKDKYGNNMGAAGLDPSQYIRQSYFNLTPDQWNNQFIGPNYQEFRDLPMTPDMVGNITPQDLLFMKLQEKANGQTMANHQGELYNYYPRGVRVDVPLTQANLSDIRNNAARSIANPGKGPIMDDNSAREALSIANSGNTNPLAYFPYLSVPDPTDPQYRSLMIGSAGIPSLPYNPVGLQLPFDPQKSIYGY